MRLRFLLPLGCAGAVLCGCLGNSGDPQNSPAGIQAMSGDSIAGLTWNSKAGVTYYVFVATNPALTALNWSDANIAGFPLNNQGSKAQPPALLCSAGNGQSYYFTVDAHTGTAPGGPGSPAILATARPAGGPGTWRPGNPIGANINAVGYATLNLCGANSGPSGTFVAVGPGGAIFMSADAVNWTSVTPVGYATDLYAVTAITGNPNVPNPSRLFVAVGAAGASITSPDGINWFPGATSNATHDTLRAMSTSGANFVAVGDNGRIQTSADGVNWSAQVSNTSANLRAVECISSTCLAVGDSGVIDGSTDGGLTWFVTTVGGGANTLRAIAFGNNDNNVSNGVIGNNWTVAINTWVVVGDNSTAFESTAVTGSASPWTTVPIIGAANFVAIGYSTQFVALDSSGNVFTSQLGTPGTWSAATSTGVNNPIAMTGNGHGSTPPLQLSPTFWISTSVNDNSHGFVAVGSAGANASSF
ncbi:MAG TPA: hypothetical protein VGY49_11240 [Burkholderiaceae bacterium]|nr:hypothetical protein [Burkholderiaceae bacterium]